MNKETEKRFKKIGSEVYENWEDYEDDVIAFIDEHFIAKEEIEKKKYPSEEKFSEESEYIEYTTANPSEPTEALMQHAYNQALDDLLKTLK